LTLIDRFTQNVGLIEQQEAFLRQRCTKNFDQTFLGTKIQVPKKVCYDGGIDQSQLAVSSRHSSHGVSLCMRRLVLSCRATAMAAIMMTPKVQNAI
jgi:hypothetical protein